MRSGGGTAAVEEPLVPCSVCFEAVADGGERSTAKLQCGHRFHLDCIGSAFNAKGAMQCPNCRKVEKGNWLFANGHRLFPELSMDDWTHDEDLYGLSYQEMDLRTGRRTSLGLESDGLYCLNGRKKTAASAYTFATTESPYLWHCWLGHPSSYKLKSLLPEPVSVNNF